MITDEKLAEIIKDLRKGQRRARRKAKLRSIWAVVWPRREVLRLRSLLHIVVARKELVHKEVALLQGQLRNMTAAASAECPRCAERRASASLAIPNVLGDYGRGENDH